MDVVCTVCGGTDYTLENGFYFCNECQTQTQEIRQEIHDDAQTNYISSKSKTSKKKSKDADNNKEKITSWEGYNYILIGLVDEMINLGASSELKLTVLQIWAAYLSKIEVAFVSKNRLHLPKLSAAFKQNDIEIIYNRRKIKKRKYYTQKSSDISSKNLISVEDKIKFSKKRTSIRKKMLKTEFEISQTSESEMNTSIQNQTLSSLESSSNSSASGVKRLKLNQTAHCECLKFLTHYHLTQHLNDTLSELSCHKFSTRSVSRGYLDSPYHLSKLKLFSILYLGVLLNCEKFQLGDMIRFCREGHLSYVSYDHFFPDYVLMNIKYKKIFNGGKQCIPNHLEVRKCAAEIAKLIGIRSIKAPTLLELCERYVKELALPKQVIPFINKIILNCPPKMQFNKSRKLIPNFEGRAMAYIIFSMKFLFGLNGFSENIISEVAIQLNKLKIHEDNQRKTEEANNLFLSDCSVIENDEKYSHRHFFVWSDWVEYIECRKYIIQNKHYPTSFQFDSENCLKTKEFINFLKNHNNKINSEEIGRVSIHDQLFRSIFIKMSSKNEVSTDNSQDFKPTLTPLYSYLNNIIENMMDVEEIPKLILANNFIGCDINFLLNFSDIINSINLKHLKKIDKIKKHTVKMFYYDIKSEKYKINKLNGLVSIKLDSKTVLDFDIDSEDSTLDIDEIKLNYFNSDNVIKSGLINDQCSNKKSEELVENLHTFEDNSDTSFCENITDNESVCSENSSIDEPFQCGQSFTKTNYNNKPKMNSVSAYISDFLLFPQNNYWLYHGNINKLTYEIFDKIENRLPNSFIWLLNYCSKVVEIPVKDLYCELICVEVYLGYVAKTAQHFLEEELAHKDIEALYKLIAICKQNW